jgi:hypothetical protein
MVFGSDTTPETIKAIYILQMQKFVTVGQSPRLPKHFCYYERHGVPFNESVGQQIEMYVRTHPDGNSPSVTRFEAIRDPSGCDLFYIPAEEEDYIDNIISALGTSSTLTISSAQRFILRGGMVGFVVDDDSRVKMEANLANARNKHVHIDASLLEIMLRVIDQ